MSEQQDPEEVNFEFQVPEFTLADYESFEDFSIKEEALLRSAVATALFRAAEFRIDKVPVCVFSDNDMVFVLNKDEYLSQFEKTIEYFSNIEEFEICSGLLEIKNFL